MSQSGFAEAPIPRAHPIPKTLEAQIEEAVEVSWQAWQCTDAIAPRRHRELVREMALEHHKWDVQVGDVGVLAPFALRIPRSEWKKLKFLAELLAHEMFCAEREVFDRPELWSKLGLPAPLRKMLGQTQWTPEAARSMRFDFHPTEAGWRISEVNSDVPGGYSEASIFTRLIADEIGNCEPAGNPLGTLAEGLAGPDRRCIALLAAPGFNEDLQVTRSVGRALQKRGVKAVFLRPDQIIWEDGAAHCRATGGLHRLDAIFRFFQAEWLARLPAEIWKPLFVGGRTPVCNPPVAVFTESKRWPLLWPELRTSMPAWRRLLPETRPAHRALFVPRRDWLLKAAYSNTGDAVLGGEWTPKREFRRAALAALLRPKQWLLQRRFEPLALATPSGPMQLCLGVYVIDGKACGIYGRLTAKSWIDYTARDVAVCLTN